MKIMAIIPARGGSKGLPNKNIKELNGLPLIAYTINEAKKSKYIDRVVVSTDSMDIAAAAERFGAEVPFMRPAELSSDSSKVMDAFNYTISRMEKEQGYEADVIVILQPTSPLRKAKHIDEALEMFLEKEADSIISVCAVEHPPFWYKLLDTNKALIPFIEGDYENANRQELPVVYRPNGAIYVLKKTLLCDKQTYETEKSYGYVMTPEVSVDIDTIIDFRLAELIMEEK